MRGLWVEVSGMTEEGRTYGCRRARRARARVLAQSRMCALQLEGCTEYADTVDHIVSLALGGDMADPANLQPACKHCNSVKGANERWQRGKPSLSRRW